MGDDLKGEDAREAGRQRGIARTTRHEEVVASSSRQSGPASGRGDAPGLPQPPPTGTSPAPHATHNPRPDTPKPPLHTERSAAARWRHDPWEARRGEGEKIARCSTESGNAWSGSLLGIIVSRVTREALRGCEGAALPQVRPRCWKVCKAALWETDGACDVRRSVQRDAR
ncbi:hypothetical protein E2C01_080242 [Portunus trituberculatus]|uniref:Uncharacterized protein n=1 Tax=Portunus trituberculatus TaxID=210409 RepID=A0A5B7IZ16_PORTR|nr:hypothetical protein [Portunus trituberculatus]